MNGYTYESFEPGLWTVGYRDPSGKFHPESDHDSTEEAADQVHYLNGGDSGTRQVRELLAEILADLQKDDVGHRVAAQMPGAWNARDARDHQVSLWIERAERAGVKLDQIALAKGNGG